MTWKSDRQLALEDGRRLGWVECGRSDGMPVFYCHGFPACRLEARLCAEAAKVTGVRLIAADRPGLGLSTFQHGRSLSDWPHDLAALADHLAIERFAVLGVSGGGPYALACAHGILSRLSAISIVGGLGPLDPSSGLLADMRWPARFSFSLARRHPRLSRNLYGRILSPLLRLRPKLVLFLLIIAAPEADRRVLAAGEVRSVLTDSIAGAFRNGGLGPACELEVLGRPWGFDPAEIALPVALWHGMSDATVPVSHGRSLAEKLPFCRSTFVPGEGHFSLPVRQMTRILKDLTASPRA